MRRREFIGLLIGAGVTGPRIAYAQQRDSVRRIAFLTGYSQDDPELKLRLAAFWQRLEKRGWSQGRNVEFIARFTSGSIDKYAPLAKELVASHPDVILAQTTQVVAAIQRETQSIPIVFVNVSDPIGSGFVTNLAHPDRNLTGVLLYEAGIVGKWLAMLKEIAPRMERAAFIANPQTSPYNYFLRAAEVAAQPLAIKIVPSPVKTVADIKSAISSFAATPNGGPLLPPDSMTIANRDLVTGLAAEYKLPAVYPFHYFVAAGGLMYYGTDQDEIFRLAAAYVDRILRGDKPADLPVQAPTKFETVINLKTAKAAGLTVPPGLIVAADEVIE
jgi:ABC-type uncharacterized transport system substrate-binding protein